MSTKKGFVINDLVYGQFEITEPVLRDLIASAAVQRMKGISQHGVPKKWHSFSHFSRYDHLIGVLVLLRDVGASVEEQIAGLLHDVSHTAFSHVADWVFGSETSNDYQDNTHEQYILSTDIPNILNKHGFDVKIALDVHSFHLLERSAPALCADRLDYTLREAAHKKDPRVKSCVAALIAHDDELIFNDRAAARMFWEMYAGLQESHWGSKEAMAQYHLLAGILKQALNEKILSMDDFYLDDAQVMAKLEATKHLQIRSALARLDAGVSIVIDDKNPEALLRTKFRYVDPPFIENGTIRRVSDIMPSYKEWLTTEKAKAAQGAPIRIVPAQ